MTKNTVEYTPSELSSMVQEGFSDIFKPFSRYPREEPEIWLKCMDTISDLDMLNKLIFCNDIVKIPPAKVFLCLHPEVAEDKNFSACDKKFVGSFFSYIFTTIFCYRCKKQVSTSNPCIKTAMVFGDRPDDIAIVPNRTGFANSTTTEPSKKLKTQKNSQKTNEGGSKDNEANKDA